MAETQEPSGAPPPANAGGESTTPFWKRSPVIVAGTLLAAVGAFLGLGAAAEHFTHESTDDAFLDADVVALASRVSGQVQRVLVEDNQSVRAGDPLVEIDPRDHEILLAQRKAASASAESNVELLKASLGLLTAQVITAQAQAAQSESEAAADQARAQFASNDLKRAESLIQNGTISSQAYDAAKTGETAAEATLRASRDKAASDRAKVAEAEAQLEAGRKAWERAQAQAKQAAVDVDQANLNLSYTRILAPQGGRVTRKSVRAGDYVEVGQRLLALVESNLWVTANFKENQLKKIRPDQPVKIRVDSMDGGRLAGHVQSIQAGSGAAFSLLPPENAVGNFVKVVQRVPVKITFDSQPQAGHVLGPGLSVVPSIRVASFEVPEVVIGLAAIGIAVAVGIFWGRAARRGPRTG